MSRSFRAPAGVRVPRVRRGQPLSRPAILSSSAWEWTPRSVPLGASVFAKVLVGAPWSRIWWTWEVACPKSWWSGLSQPPWIA
jgi:hypothetical protein